VKSRSAAYLGTVAVEMTVEKKCGSCDTDKVAAASSGGVVFQGRRAPEGLCAFIFEPPSVRASLRIGQWQPDAGPKCSMNSDLIEPNPFPKGLSMSDGTAAGCAQETPPAVRNCTRDDPEPNDQSETNI